MSRASHTLYTYGVEVKQNQNENYADFLRLHVVVVLLRRRCTVSKKAIFILGNYISISSRQDDPVWRWECERGFCQKKRITDGNKDTAMSLAACRLFCSNHAGLWPQPTGEVKLGNVLIHIDPDAIELNEKKDVVPIASLIRGAMDRFKSHLNDLKPKRAKASNRKGLPLIVNLVIEDEETRQLKIGVNESYKLLVRSNDDKLIAEVHAKTFFGGRHALETLGQLIVYDDIRHELQVPRDISIIDGPVYPHRGILLDTGRNFVDVDVIKRTIDGMAASKLNVFHWHITDTQSFPYYSKTRPELSRIGAYKQSDVYTEEDVKDIIEFATERGVKVIPEFDAPAHVGEGWQDTGFVACFNKHPWQQYCVEPPCGQFDPTQEKLYDHLEGLYQ